jgi:hypothetical protein
MIHATHSLLVRSVFFLVVILVAMPHDAAAQRKPGGSSTASSSASSSSSSAAAAAPASNAPIEVEWLAYGALDEVLQKVADYSCNPNSGFAKVVVVDTPALQALQAYDSFYEQAEALNAAFVQMAPPSGAGATIDIFADITSAITNAAIATTSESSYSFTIQDPTAAIVLLGKLNKEEFEVCKSAYYGGVYHSTGETPQPAAKEGGKKKTPPAAGGAANKNPLPPAAKEDDKKKTPSAAGQAANKKRLPSVAEELANLAKTRADTLRTIIGHDEDIPDACYAKPTPVTGSPGTAAISSQDPCVTAFNSIDTTYNSFLAALSTPNATTGQPAISAAMQGYDIRALFETADENSPILGIYLSIAAAGGTQQDKKNLITALFTGDWISYSGGASVNVVLFAYAGEKSSSSQILFSDLIRYRTPFTRIEKPRPPKSLNAADNLGVIPSEKITFRKVTEQGSPTGQALPASQPPTSDQAPNRGPDR